MTSPKPPTFRDLAEILWLPLIVGVVTAAITWLIWYYTSVPCPPEVAVLHHCNPAPIARYINAEIWALCLTLGGLIGGIVGGGANYTMFSRERAARIAAEIMAEEYRKQREEERKLREEDRRAWELERRQREEERIAERQRIDQLVVQVAESQRLSVESQQVVMSAIVENQQAMMVAITALTEGMAELRRQRNGENGHQ